MKSTADKLFVIGAKVLGWAFAGAVVAWCLFYVADFVLLRTTSIHLYHQGELLMDAIHKPTDSLVLGLSPILLALGIRCNHRRDLWHGSHCKAEMNVTDQVPRHRLKLINRSTTNHCTRPATVRSFLAPLRGRVNSGVVWPRAVWMRA